MYLITMRMKGHELPDTLPPSLRASIRAGSAASLTPQPTPSISSPPSPSPSPAPSPAVPSAAPVLASSGSASALTSSGSSSSLQPYKIPPEELTQYSKLFDQVDTDRDGYITGDQAKPVLSLSNLPVPDLRQIWALAVRVMTLL